MQPGVFTLPFPYWHQLGLPADTPASQLSELCLNQLSLLLSQATNAKDTAAIIIEPVIGEGGYVPAPPEFLKGLREVCDEHGILLIIDEVQAGFGRTGKNYSIEYSGVRPDILLSAKVNVLQHTYGLELTDRCTDCDRGSRTASLSVLSLAAGS